MIIICWFVSQIKALNMPLSQHLYEDFPIPGSSDPIFSIQSIPLIQWMSFISILIASFWIIYTLTKMRHSLAFDKTPKSGTIYLRTQILTVITLAVLIVGTFSIFNIDYKTGQFAIVFSIFTGIIGIIYTDVIRSITAYIHLSKNNHIKVGDWISIPKHGIDGKINSVSMISVSIENWDNSISTIPTYTMLNEHMQNFQRILDVDDIGRKLCKTFIIDSSSIHSLVEEEIKMLKEYLERQSQDIITLKDVKYPTNNLRLYRQFIHHWLKGQKDITHSPRLLAYLLDPTPEGIPLQIYVFLLTSQKEYFERYQSEITEFILMSMEWFGLRLYQRPSDHNIYKLSQNIKHHENN